MSTGKDPKTMPVTAEYEAGYERIFGKREPVRGKWIWSDKLGRLVSPDEYEPQPEEAINAPILAGRFYENTQATDGTDIGSRRKRREWMKEHGYADASDYSNAWKKAAAAREASLRPGTHAKEVKTAVVEAYRKLRYSSRRG